jgi:antitoxin ParD1/3/4
MSITFNAEQAEIIQTFLQTGQFESAEEVIQVALRLLEQQDREYQQWLAENRAKVEIGLAELQRGEGIEGEVVIARLREKVWRSLLLPN